MKALSLRSRWGFNLMTWNWNGFSELPLSLRLFIGLFLSLAGLCYVTLLGSIWYDTQWSLAAISEGYGSMGNIELFHHSFKHLFWFFGIFGFAIFLFLLTNASEKAKQWMTASIPIVIVSDIGSAWLVRFSGAFSYVMFASGVFLSVCFLGIYLKVQSELWPKKQSRSS